MPDVIEQAAPWLAAATGIAAATVIAWTGWHAWRRWRELRIVHHAAVALVDVHAERLEASVQEASRATGVLAEDGEQVAEALAELRADVAHLRWMASRVGDERELLVRELVDAVLPTRPSGRDDG